jgi:hypothetical protein
LFYSGHGHYGADGSYYLTTHDTQLQGVPGHRTVVAETAVSQQELLACLRALPAQRTLLIFNACHAGTINPVLDGDETPKTGQSLPPSAAAALLATGSGRVIITACRENQYAFIGGGELTIFTQALIACLRGTGLPNRGGYISVFDLYSLLYSLVSDTVRQQVPEAIRQQYGGMQEPELTILKGVGPFAVALYPSTAPCTCTGPPILTSGGVVREVTPDESRQAFAQLVAGTNLGSVSATTVDGGSSVQAAHDTAGRDIHHSPQTFTIHGPIHAGTVNVGGTLTIQGGVTATIGDRLAPPGTSVVSPGTGQPAGPLMQVAAQLAALLQDVPDSKTAAAETISRRLAALIAETRQEKPDSELLVYYAESLRRAAAELPAAIGLAVQLGTLVTGGDQGQQDR